VDLNCPDNTMYFINESGIRFHSYKLETTRKIQGLEISMGELPLQNTLALSYEIAITPQMSLRNRQKDVAILKDVAK